MFPSRKNRTPTLTHAQHTSSAPYGSQRLWTRADDGAHFVDDTASPTTSINVAVAADEAAATATPTEPHAGGARMNTAEAGLAEQPQTAGEQSVCNADLPTDAAQRAVELRRRRLAAALEQALQVC